MGEGWVSSSVSFEAPLTLVSQTTVCYGVGKLSKENLAVLKVSLCSIEVCKSGLNVACGHCYTIGSSDPDIGELNDVCVSIDCQHAVVDNEGSWVNLNLEAMVDRIVDDWVSCRERSPVALSTIDNFESTSCLLYTSDAADE